MNGIWDYYDQHIKLGILRKRLLSLPHLVVNKVRTKSTFAVNSAADKFKHYEQIGDRLMLTYVKVLFTFIGVLFYMAALLLNAFTRGVVALFQLALYGKTVSLTGELDEINKEPTEAGTSERVFTPGPTGVLTPEPSCTNCGDHDVYSRSYVEVQCASKRSNSSVGIGDEQSEPYPQDGKQCAEDAAARDSPVDMDYEKIPEGKSAKSSPTTEHIL